MKKGKNGMRGHLRRCRRVGVASMFGVSLLIAVLYGGCASQRCYEDQDCKASQICGPSGVCIFECSSDPDCGLGFQCRDHRCVPRSTGAISCPDDMVNVADVFCADRYEASRPDATSTSAGTDSTCARSVAGAVPWQVTSNAAAETACAAVGKRLCAPEEWRLACKGPDNAVYAYGNTYDPGTCNGIDAFGRSNFHLAPTGSFPQCTNEWGLFDINGNLWEHVSGGSDQTVRGGAYNCGDSAALHKCDYVPGDWSPSARGFRCCLTPVSTTDDGGRTDADGAYLDGGDPSPSDGGGCVGEEDGGEPDGGDSGDTAGGDSGYCSDGVINGSEDCDGEAPFTETCQSLGFDDGTLACGGDCHFDTSGCISTWSCGDALIDDRDGKSYATVSLGGLCWMAQNLDVGVQLSASQQQSNQGQLDKYCYGDQATNCATFGGLYQWNEAMQYSTAAGAAGICPAGWRIPADAEWKVLEISQGMSAPDADLEGWRGAPAGAALKAGGASGFNALLGGAISGGSSFNGATWGYYWTSSVGSPGPWRRCFTSTTTPYSPDQVGRWQSWPATYALSIRCVRAN